MAIPWLIDVLRQAGLPVVEEGNWRDRSVSGAFDPFGVLWHHTAARSSPTNPAPSLSTVINGRPDLQGPLCHALVDYNGVFHLIAAGRANHAGAARASGPIPAGDGNTMLIGWEIDYEGDPSAADPQHMTDAQYQNSVTATAAVLTYLGRDASYARGHRETSTTGKQDPAFVDLDVMRADVAARMAGGRTGNVQHQVRNADGSWRGLSAVPAPGGTGAQGSKAAVAVLNDGAVLVVDIGPDGVLYHQVRRADGTWSGFQGVPAPGNAAARGSEVAAAGLPDGSVLLADVGPDGAVYYQLRRPDGSWSGFKTVPAPGNAAAKGSKVAVAGLPDGSAFLADIGPDGALYYQIRRPNDTWTGFQVVPAPGNATARGSELAAAGLRDGSVLLADVGPDGVVYYQLRRPDGSWSGFKAVPAPGNAAAKGSKVTVAGLPDGSALLADIGPDGVVYHQVRRPNDTWTGFQTVPGANNAPAHATEITAVGLADSTVQLVIVAPK
ncbi:N-acetylmuramoyl-L-alanine amidase [Actinoplanes sp. NPDC051343]|uniref:N-acetylmuramoyl-L-alanine amidase n=1 Tax=Actinoplanes sp. NPDC051343 TaxID=3363906 RepID=UPI0037BCB5EC